MWCFSFPQGGALGLLFFSAQPQPWRELRYVSYLDSSRWQPCSVKRAQRRSRESRGDDHLIRQLWRFQAGVSWRNVRLPRKSDLGAVAEHVRCTLLNTGNEKYGWTKTMCDLCSCPVLLWALSKQRCLWEVMWTCWRSCYSPEKNGPLWWTGVMKRLFKLFKAQATGSGITPSSSSLSP